MVLRQAFNHLTYGAYLVHRQWMSRAIALAATAGDAGEVPVGAVIVDGTGGLIAETNNRKERDGDSTAHAEILAIRHACRVIENYYLQNCTLYVTLEPCPMCAGAIIQARLGLLVYGASDPKTGAIRTVINLPDSASSNHHLPIVAGVRETECRQQLQTWFASRRKQRK